MTQFHTLLKQYRQEANKSLEELAEDIRKKDPSKIKLTAATLYRWENEKNIPQHNLHTRYILLHLAKAFNLSLEECNQFLKAAHHNPLSKAEQTSFYPEEENANAVLPARQLIARLQTCIEELLSHFNSSFPAPENYY